MKRPLVALALVAALAMPTLAQAATWKIDSAHSSANFQIRHLFSKVHGKFNELSGTIEFDPANPTSSKVEALLVAASINTANEKRDEDLKSANFFDVATYPELTFKSTKVEKVEKGLEVAGDLTMHGVTKPVVLEVEILGSGPHPFIPNGQVAGFSARTKVNRQDFGIKWNKALDNGGALLGDEVEIHIEIEAVSVPVS